MSNTRARVFAAILMLWISGSLNVKAQSPSVSEPSGLALEIDFRKPDAPAFLSVPGGVWSGRFNKIVSWQPPAGSLPTRAVYVRTSKEGESVRVKVSVLAGVHSHEKELPVGSYLISENEKITVTELKNFGVEPLEITLVRVSPLPPVLPFVENNTKSVEVVSIEPANTNFPNFNLKARNLSSKNIIAIDLKIKVGEKAKLVGSPMGKEGLPLIEAGGVYEKRILGYQNPLLTSDGYTPDAPMNQTIHIGTVVFEDGSYEGDAAVAARIRARIAGQKLGLARVVSVLQDAFADEHLNSLKELERLRKEMASVDFKVKAADATKLLEDFPDLDPVSAGRMASTIEIAARFIRKSIFDDIDQFETSQKGSFDLRSYQAWLKSTKERYEQWLSRLSSSSATK